MNPTTPWLIAADAVLLAHVLFVLFVVAGLVLIYAGRWRGWSWVRGRGFRLVHLAAIGVVVAQSWFGLRCPLTSLEGALRLRAGEATYAGTFLSHWLETLLYYRAPDWVFVVAYTLFGAAVLASWFVVPPHRCDRTPADRPLGRRG